MALEKHRTGLFDTLALPPLHESYRNLIFQQLYDKFDLAPFQSVCWATQEEGYGPEFQSKIVVLPGEERYLVENHGIYFSILKPLAFRCPYRNEEHKPAKNQPMGEDGGPTLRKVHYCSLAVDVRPLMCRAFPFGFARIPKNNRKLAIMADMRGLRVVRRRLGGNVVNQLMHNVIQLAISLWPFLDEKWWSYYEGAYGPKWRFQEVSQVDFTLTDDIVLSNIRGASPAWRTEILAQIANPSCTSCEGAGVEFWDCTLDGKMFPVPQRRFDICRKCVLPEIGAVFNGLLVDPTSRKVLDATGKEYRGDQILLEDWKDRK